ncbi:MAG: PilZ domain-containing protein [Oleiphilaceae bacterium]|nr:PilZ domain-containing protein [Oleiphilaceae bacterium]
MSTDLPTERRDYFRIDDRIGLEFRKLLPDHDDSSSPFEESHIGSLRTELRQIDLDLRSQLAGVAERDRAMSNLIKTLSSKIDTVARIMAFEQNPLQPEDWQPVTLSEGGVSFTAPENALAIGDKVALRMTLPPELFQVEAKARILHVSDADSPEPIFHAEFKELSEPDRQKIAKHIMRWQIRHRQQNEAEGD